MSTKSTNIRIDEKTKAEAIKLFSYFGLGLSDAINMFLRVSIERQAVPFPLIKNTETEEEIWERRRKKFEEFLKFARANPVFEKGYKFKREECYDRCRRARIELRDAYQ